VAGQVVESISKGKQVVDEDLASGDESDDQQAEDSEEGEVDISGDYGDESGEGESGSGEDSDKVEAKSSKSPNSESEDPQFMGKTKKVVDDSSSG
jgi:hypothetical protein